SVDLPAWSAMLFPLYFDLSPLCSVFFLLSDQKIITAEPGQNVMLPCRAPNNSSSITGVEWSRADLGDEYVLLYRDELFDPDYQHPSFKNRDRQMKDGDVSLILKNVTINDTGIYKCRVFTGETRSWETINTFNLTVSGK
uniref:Ig-like domain-containing protein n=1 Tax=Maylandia zebra TaxID=106582 RepID=A0A3P9DBT7_9CICH